MPVECEYREVIHPESGESGANALPEADEVVLGTGKSVTTTLDNNGNAFVVALAQAGLVGPPFTTLTTNFVVLSPRVTG